MRAIIPILFATTALYAQSPDVASTTLETAQQQRIDWQLPADPQIELPKGFTATIVHEGIGRARHIVANPREGIAPDLYVAMRAKRHTPEGGIAALRDTTGNGVYDHLEYFSQIWGTGITIHNGYLYRSSDEAVYRWQLPSDGSLIPEGEPELIAGDLPASGGHRAKAITLDEKGNLYVDVGAPSNANMQSPRTPESQGVYPADQLVRRGSIWRFDANKPNQMQMEDGEQFATSLRHAVALEYNKSADKLYMVMHGRDQLDTLWPGVYTAEENAQLPAEEMHIIERGDLFGWPYSYWDPKRDKRIIAPEYAWKFSDGQFKVPANNPDWKDPIAAFPAHWAPNDLLFYQPIKNGQSLFPEEYHHGAFIVFHGSWNRAPKPQQGYNVSFQPLDPKTGLPNGKWRKFATGFPGKDVISSPREADFRPMGIAQGDQGELYVVDSGAGRIWRISYEN